MAYPEEASDIDRGVLSAPATAVFSGGTANRALRIDLTKCDVAPQVEVGNSAAIVVLRGDQIVDLALREELAPARIELQVVPPAEETDALRPAVGRRKVHGFAASEAPAIRLRVASAALEVTLKGGDYRERLAIALRSLNDDEARSVTSSTLEIEDAEAEVTGRFNLVQVKRAALIAGRVENAELYEGAALRAKEIEHADVASRATVTLTVQKLAQLILRDGSSAVIRYDRSAGASLGVVELDGTAVVELSPLGPASRADGKRKYLSVDQLVGRPCGNLSVNVTADSGTAVLKIVRAALNVAFSRDCLLVVEGEGILNRCTFGNSRLVALPGATVINCTGHIRVVSARESTIIGPLHPREKLLFELDSEPSEALDELAIDTSEGKPFEHAVLRYVTLAPNNTRLRTISSMREASIFDPELVFGPFWVRSRGAKAGLSPERMVGAGAVPELIGQVCSEKSTLGSTRSIAEYNAMESRRGHVSSRLERNLLALYKLVGYGRRPGPALVTWLALVGMELGWRLRDGLSTTNVDTLAKAGISTLLPPAAVITKEVPPTAVDLAFRLLISLVLVFALIAISRYGRISRKID